METEDRQNCWEETIEQIYALRQTLQCWANLEDDQYTQVCLTQASIALDKVENAITEPPQAAREPMTADDILIAVFGK